MYGLTCRMGVESDLIVHLLHDTLSVLVHLRHDIDSALGAASTFEFKSSVCICYP